MEHAIILKNTHTHTHTHEVMNAACDESVPWWTEELTVVRKRTNALRRFQRTRNKEGLREQCKTSYLEEKVRYEATIKREKIHSWKEYCNLTTSTNPWNEVYKLAEGKSRNNTQIMTLKKPDGSLTEDVRETLQLMLEHFTLEDKEEDDIDHHKLDRAHAREPAVTADDKGFTVEETRYVVASMDKKKVPGEDGITGQMYKSAFEIFPRYITAMYNGCLRSGVFPKRWKTAKLIPIVKPGKENSDEVSKFRPILIA
jgi:hypothetical protein